MKTLSDPLSSYRHVSNRGQVESADPVRLIKMLLDAASDSIARARGHLDRREVAAKGEQIGRAIAIVEGLRAALDLGAGDIASNLDQLYEYIAGRLLAANLNDDHDALAEASRLLGEIKQGWDGISAAR